ncbi:MAG: hypothetical protein WCE60_06170 [Methanobacterium sp.]
MKILLGLILIELLATPTGITASTTKTHVDVANTIGYDPYINTFYSGTNCIGHEYNLMVKLSETSRKSIKDEALKIIPSEKPNQNINKNGMSSERIITKNDDSDREVHEFIDEWFRDRYSNIPQEEYDILVKFDGDYRHVLGRTERPINYTTSEILPIKNPQKNIETIMEGNF